MKIIADRFFESGRLSVCVKDREGSVLYQNEACLAVCGDMSAAVCEKGCMCCYTPNPDAPEREEGTQYYPNELIEGKYYDFLFINDGEHLTTLLYPLEDRHEADMQDASRYDLTKREQEIIRLVIQGHTNAQIAKKLFISIATLKKHMNNIHKKVPVSVFPR